MAGRRVLVGRVGMGQRVLMERVGMGQWILMGRVRGAAGQNFFFLLKFKNNPIKSK
jgi:hypothetical protein